METPPLEATPGQLLRIEGQLQWLETSPEAYVNISDNAGGQLLSLRQTHNGAFRIYRLAPSGGFFQLHVSMHGAGAARLQGLRIDRQDDRAVRSGSDQ